MNNNGNENNNSSDCSDNEDTDDILTVDKLQSIYDYDFDGFRDSDKISNLECGRDWTDAMNIVREKNYYNLDNILATAHKDSHRDSSEENELKSDQLLNDFDGFTAGGNNDAKQDDESKVQIQNEKVNDEKDLYNGEDESNKDENKDKSKIKSGKAEIDDDSSDNE